MFVGLIIESFGLNRMTQISFKISLDSISFGKLPNNGVHFSAFVFDATVLVTSYMSEKCLRGFRSVKKLN